MRWRLAGCALLAATIACGDGGMPAAPTASPSPSPSPAPDPQGWVALTGSPLSPGAGRHDDVFFLDERSGWLVNTRGEVHRTRDGGETWQQLTHLPEVILRCVGFASDTRGWAGNINRTNVGQALPDVSLWETEDGGSTWANVSARIEGAPVVGLCGMRVLDRVVVAVGRWNGPAVFVKSTNGGRTWTSRSLAALATGLVDVVFFNEQDGLAVGGLGVGPSEAEQRSSRTVILGTSDGGATWDTRYVSAGTGEWAWKIHFADDRVGYVTTEGPTPAGVVVKTTDGGTTWRPVPVSPGAAFEGVAFVTPERGWVGTVPTLFATADGGASWTPLHFGARINRMRVVAPDLVYASGDRVYRWTP